MVADKPISVAVIDLPHRCLLGLRIAILILRFSQKFIMPRDLHMIHLFTGKDEARNDQKKEKQ